MTKLKVCAFQMNIEFERAEENCRQLATTARCAANDGADVLVTPETFSLGFSMNTRLVAAHSRETCQAIQDAARENNINIIAGVARELRNHATSNQSYINAVVVVNRLGETIYEYIKTHLFSPMREDVFFYAGTGMQPFELEGVRLGIGICYDLRFPELFRAIASDVDAIIIPANWPAARQLHWDTLLRARAIENQAYVYGVNRVGEGGGVQYNGGTAVYSPQGELLAVKYTSPGCITETIDSNAVTDIRQNFPYLRDAW